MSVLSYFPSYIISLKRKEGRSFLEKLLGSMTATINIFKWLVANTVPPCIGRNSKYFHETRMKQWPRRKWDIKCFCTSNWPLNFLQSNFLHIPACLLCIPFWKQKTKNFLLFISCNVTLKTIAYFWNDYIILILRNM